MADAPRSVLTSSNDELGAIAGVDKTRIEHAFGADEGQVPLRPSARQRSVNTNWNCATLFFCWIL